MSATSPSEMSRFLGPAKHLRCPSEIIIALWFFVLLALAKECVRVSAHASFGVEAEEQPESVWQDDK